MGHDRTDHIFFAKTAARRDFGIFVKKILAIVILDADASRHIGQGFLKFPA
jgi:hypothetical protein